MVGQLEVDQPAGLAWGAGGDDVVGRGVTMYHHPRCIVIADFREVAAKLIEQRARVRLPPSEPIVVLACVQSARLCRAPIGVTTGRGATLRSATTWW